MAGQLTEKLTRGLPGPDRSGVATRSPQYPARSGGARGRAARRRGFGVGSTATCPAAARSSRGLMPPVSRLQRRTRSSQNMSRLRRSVGATTIHPPDRPTAQAKSRREDPAPPPCEVSGWPMRYALYRSYVLSPWPPIEPISHLIRAWVPLGKAQRLDRQAYESPALPLSYSATAIKIIERDPRRQPTTEQRITIQLKVHGPLVDAGPVRTPAGLDLARLHPGTEDADHRPTPPLRSPGLCCRGHATTIARSRPGAWRGGACGLSDAGRRSSVEFRRSVYVLGRGDDPDHGARRPSGLSPATSQRPAERRSSQWSRLGADGVLLPGRHSAANSTLTAS